MRRTVAVIAILAGLTSACAHENEGYLPPPNFRPIETQPAPNARFYADCIAQAAEVGAYGRASDADTRMVLFTCTGAPARAFYEGLAARSAAVGSEVPTNGRTIRSTNRVRQNLFGVDWCSTDGAGDYRCVVSLNAGDFLDGE
ncbi:hypothetical protein [uncultured Brevundimonas sp.]|uniref:hypothetical protein n=1 Tax=uncultured Brevundimonas sp. TaxID=213418 RepID=UPI002622F27E|nr:hypothetical protein [uncultured Brevundimonas sp.]